MEAVLLLPFLIIDLEFLCVHCTKTFIYVILFLEHLLGRLLTDQIYADAVK